MARNAVGKMPTLKHNRSGGMMGRDILVFSSKLGQLVECLVLLHCYVACRNSFSIDMSKLLAMLHVGVPACRF